MAHHLWAEIGSSSKIEAFIVRFPEVRVDEHL